MENKNKIRFNVYLSKKIYDKAKSHQEMDGDKSLSHFVEQAVEFYCDYIETQDNTNFLAPVISEVVEGKINGAERRISRNLFKVAVETAVLTHMLAAMHKIDDETMTILRGNCIKEVKKINGTIDFEEAVRIQRMNIEDK